MAARPHHFLLLAALLLLIGAPSSAGAVDDVVAAGNGKVPVELYYESLCPPLSAVRGGPPRRSLGGRPPGGRGRDSRPLRQRQGRQGRHYHL